MKHRITAAIAAAAIALTAAAPVRADSNDALKLALGAVGVGLLVHELDKKNREEAATVVDDRWSDDWTSRNRYDDSFRKKGKIIPAQCIFDGKIRGRWREVVSYRCMTDFGVARRLPGECRVNVRHRGDHRQAYGLNCLEDKGYRVARWRR